MSTLGDMLGAAEAAAGADWGVIKGDLSGFAQELIQSTADTAANLAKGAISKDEAKVLFDQEADFSAMIANYATVALKAAAQDAFNAAVDALWAAITRAIP